MAKPKDPIVQALFRNAGYLDIETLGLGTEVPIHQVSFLNRATNSATEWIPSPVGLIRSDPTDLMRGRFRGALNFPDWPSAVAAHKSGWIDEKLGTVVSSGGVSEPLYPHLLGQRVGSSRTVAAGGERIATSIVQGLGIEDVYRNVIREASKGSGVLWMANPRFESRMFGGIGEVYNITNELRSSLTHAPKYINELLYVNDPMIHAARSRALATGDWRGVWQAIKGIDTSKPGVKVLDVQDVFRASQSYAHELDTIANLNLNIGDASTSVGLDIQGRIMGLPSEFHRATEDNLWAALTGEKSASHIEAFESMTQRAQRATGAALLVENAVEADALNWAFRVGEFKRRAASSYLKYSTIARSMQDLETVGQTSYNVGWTGRRVEMLHEGRDISAVISAPRRQTFTTQESFLDYLATTQRGSGFDVRALHQEVEARVVSEMARTGETRQDVLKRLVETGAEQEVRPILNDVASLNRYNVGDALGAGAPGAPPGGAPPPPPRPPTTGAPVHPTTPSGPGMPSPTRTATHGMGRGLKAVLIGATIIGAASLAQGIYKTISSKDDAYNTIPGMNESGYAAYLRKQNTDFGSGWKSKIAQSIVYRMLGIKDEQEYKEITIWANKRFAKNLEEIDKKFDATRNQLFGAFTERTKLAAPIQKLGSAIHDFVFDRIYGRKNWPSLSLSEANALFVKTEGLLTERGWRIISTLKDDPEFGQDSRGWASWRDRVIWLNKEEAGSKTLPHEMGHAIDMERGRGSLFTERMKDVLDGKINVKSKFNKRLAKGFKLTFASTKIGILKYLFMTHRGEVWQDRWAARPHEQYADSFAMFLEGRKVHPEVYDYFKRAISDLEMSKPRPEIGELPSAPLIISSGSWSEFKTGVLPGGETNWAQGSVKVNVGPGRTLETTRFNKGVQFSNASLGIESLTNPIPANNTLHTRRFIGGSKRLSSKPKVKIPTARDIAKLSPLRRDPLMHLTSAQFSGNVEIAGTGHELLDRLKGRARDESQLLRRHEINELHIWSVQQPLGVTEMASNTSPVSPKRSPAVKKRTLSRSNAKPRKYRHLELGLGLYDTKYGRRGKKSVKFNRRRDAEKEGIKKLALDAELNRSRLPEVTRKLRMLGYTGEEIEQMAPDRRLRLATEGTSPRNSPAVPPATEPPRLNNSKIVTTPPPEIPKVVPVNPPSTTTRPISTVPETREPSPTATTTTTSTPVAEAAGDGPPIKPPTVTESAIDAAPKPGSSTDSIAIKVPKGKMGGIVLGVAAGIVMGAIAYAAFSGRGSEYNTQKGLQERGVNAENRNRNTDFGSPYQGLWESASLFLASGGVHSTPTWVNAVPIDQQIADFRDQMMQTPFQKRLIEQKLQKQELESMNRFYFLSPELTTPIASGAYSQYSLTKRQDLQVADISNMNWAVEDADTIILKESLKGAFGKQMEIRLSGIDSPEVQHNDESMADLRYKQGQPHGEESRQILQEILSSAKDIKLVVDPAADTYGRALGVIIADGKNVNLELVRRGAAAALPFGETSEDIIPREMLMSAERASYGQRRGMWSDEYWRTYRQSVSEQQRVTFNTLTRIDKLAGNMNFAALESTMSLAAVNSNDPRVDEQIPYLRRKLANLGKKKEWVDYKIDINYQSNQPHLDQLKLETGRHMKMHGNMISDSYMGSTSGQIGQLAFPVDSLERSSSVHYLKMPAVVDKYHKKYARRKVQGATQRQANRDIAGNQNVVRS